MKRRLAICMLLGSVSVGCGAKHEAVSPFAGTGASALRGVIAVGHLSSDMLQVEWVPESYREALPEGVHVTYVWLDEDLYGGSQAFLLQGQDPEQIMASLLESGLLSATDRPGSFQLTNLGLPSWDLADAFPGRGGPGGPGGPGGLGDGESAAGDILQRHTSGDRLVLVPTVDLRAWMFELGAALDAHRTAVPMLACAVDGRSVGRIIREEVQPRFQMASGIFGAVADSERESGGAALLLYMRSLLEAATQFEGAVLLFTEQQGKLHWDVRLTANADTPLQRIFDAFEPLPELLEEDSSEAAALFGVAANPTRLCGALGSLVAPLLVKSSPALVEQVDSVLEFVREHFDGVLLGARPASQEELHMELSLKPGTQRADLEILEQLGLLREPWRLEQSTLIIGAGKRIQRSEGGPSEVVARMWGFEAGILTGVQKGEVSRIERGLRLQYDAVFPE